MPVCCLTQETQLLDDEIYLKMFRLRRKQFTERHLDWTVNQYFVVEKEKLNCFHQMFFVL